MTILTSCTLISSYTKSNPFKNSLQRNTLILVQLVAKVTAFPALNGTTSSGYTAYSTTSTSNPPKVPGSPGCISPDSTTGMVGSNGFEASLYDEFNKFSRNSQANQYLLPAQTSVVQQGPPLQQGTYLVAPKTEPRNEDYSRFIFCRIAQKFF